MHLKVIGKSRPQAVLDGCVPFVGCKAAWMAPLGTIWLYSMRLATPGLRSWRSPSLLYMGGDLSLQPEALNGIVTTVELNTRQFVVSL